jgi:hypothetical protein
MDSHHDDVAACQPKLLSDEQINRVRSSMLEPCGGFIDKYGYPFCRGRIFDTVELMTGQYDYQKINIMGNRCLHDDSQ